MPFSMKNSTNTSQKTMTKVFMEYMDKFLKKEGRFEWVLAYVSKALTPI
jgi:hypothetical protein